MLRNSSGGVSLESYLAPSGVPMDDVRVQLAFEPFVRVELPAAVELVLQVAEDLLGGGVVQAVALAAHGLADAEAFELVPPPLVLVLPSHVRVQDRLHVRPGHVRWARQVVVVRGFRQPGYPQEVVEPVSPPCGQSDDGASLAPRGLDACRARSFSRYATFAFR